MGLKTLLGMEQFKVTDREIMRKIEEAREKHLQEVVFFAGKKKVVLRLSEFHPEGLMDNWHEYYKNSAQ